VALIERTIAVDASEQDGTRIDRFRHFAGLTAFLQQSTDDQPPAAARDA
jgi:hypothetical protein